MQSAFDSTLLAAHCICKFVIAQYLLNETATPLVVALFISATLAIINGLAYQFKSNSTADPVQMRIQVVAAADIILFCLIAYRVDYAAVSFYQLLSAINLNNSNRVQTLACLIIGLVGCMIFPATSKLLELGLVFLYRLANSEYVRLKKQASPSTVLQSEFTSSLALAMTLLLLTKDSGSAFMDVARTQSSVLLIGIFAGLAYYGHRRHETDSMQSNLLSFFVLSVVSALIFLAGQDLLLALLAIIVTSIGAYLSLLQREARRIDGTLPAAPSKSLETVKLVTIIVLTAFVLVSHLDAMNADLVTAADLTEELRRDFLDSLAKPHYAKYINASNIEPGIRKQLRLQCLAKAKEYITQSVAPLMRPGADYTMMEFPPHWNLGDSFIWQSNEIFLKGLGQMGTRVRYPYVNAGVLIKDKFNGTLFCNGGGNFGDLYRASQNIRLNAIKSLKESRAILLPQSIHYKVLNMTDKDRVAFEGHKDLTMMFRDFESLSFSRKYFPRTESMFVPDMAYVLGPQMPNVDPVVDIFVLIRADVEASQALNKTLGKSPDFITVKNQTLAAIKKYPGVTAEVYDFPVDGFPVRRNKAKVVEWDYNTLYPGRLLPEKVTTSDGMAQYKTAMGNSLLSRGRVVITDRLHASIMSTLLDRPVVYLDTMYRKISRVRNSLASVIPECGHNILELRAAETIEEAVAVAVEVLKKLKSN